MPVSSKPRPHDPGLGRYRRIGRYDSVDRARRPPNDIAPRPRSKALQTAVVAVPDPIHDPYASGPPQRIQARVNRRVDVLEYERSHDRISDAAYQVGREVQATLERGSRLGSPSRIAEGDRVDAAAAHEDKIVGSVEAAQRVRALERRIDVAIGEMGRRFLRRILVEGFSFASYAEFTGRGGDRGAAGVASHFRQLLEDLAEAWAARGPTKRS